VNSQPRSATSASAHRERPDTLREKEADLTRCFAAHAHPAPDGAAVAGLAEQVDAIVAKGNPEQAKELLRLLVNAVRVHNRRDRPDQSGSGGGSRDTS
jgi:hypothetical protein